MATSSNSTPAPDFDIESAIHELYGATSCLNLFTEVTFPNNDKREGHFDGFRVFRLNDQQYVALFFLLYAVSTRVHHLRESLGFGETPKVES